MTLTRKPKLQHIVVVGMSTMRVKGRLEGIHTEWNIDTGAKRMFVSNETFGSILGKTTLGPVSATYVVADGRTLDCAGESTMVLIFGDLVIVGYKRHNLIGEDFILRFCCR